MSGNSLTYASPSPSPVRGGLCRLGCLLASAIVLAASGCDAPIDAFEPNRLLARRLEMSEQVDLAAVTADTQALLEHLFGTPDAPRWPDFLAAQPELAELVSTEKLQRAAGAVRSDQQDQHFGLYREHCILCHGIAGNGLGATSRLLNPYPRDFRLGKFKFKSTPIGSRPTREDLIRTLYNGIPGTSMPAFHLLPAEDLSALVDYVIYLAIRGEVERNLLLMATYELDMDAGQRLTDGSPVGSHSAAVTSHWPAVEQSVIDIARKWAEAPEQALLGVAPPADKPLVGGPLQTEEQQAQLAASIEHGRELFRGQVANCASCHGPQGAGDGTVNDYDEWTKDWTTAAGLDPADREQLRPMLQAGALKPRHILPRNLQSGVYRGGARPEDLYRRIVLGIEGTPMPAAPLQPDIPGGLSESDVWDLVNYLLSLPGDRPGDASGQPGGQL